MNMIWSKTNFMEKPFQTVIVSKVELKQVKPPLFLPHFMGRHSHVKLLSLCKP